MTAVDGEALKRYAGDMIRDARKERTELVDREQTPENIKKISVCNARINTLNEIISLVDLNKLPYQPPTRVPTQFERMDSITEGGKKPKALAAANVGIGDLVEAVEQYMAAHVAAAQEVQRVRNVFAAISTMVNVPGLNGEVDLKSLQGAALDDALPVGERTDDWYTDRIFEQISNELDHQQERGYDIGHDFSHHSPEDMLQQAAQYRSSAEYLRFAAMAVAAARLDFYRREVSK